MLKSYIKKRSHLFWGVREEARQNLSMNAVVETVLQYGNIQDIKELFELSGIDRVADIFFEQISRKRNNYQPRTIHFFRLYFEKHAHRHTHS